MNRYIILLFLFVSLIVSGCGISQQSVSGKADFKTHTHKFEENGLALNANIKIGKDIKVDATLTNVSGKPIIYNGRCGIPFRINIKKADADSYLNSSEKGKACADVFNPDDLRELKPNKTIKKEITYKREVPLTNAKSISALSGEYEVSFSFQTHENGHFYSSLPIELKNDREPDIITVEEAREMALKNEKVARWHDQHKNESMEIEPEDAILTDGEWTVAFHAIQKDGVDRIIISMDAKSGKISSIHYEQLDKDAREFLEDD